MWIAKEMFAKQKCLGAAERKRENKLKFIITSFSPEGEVNFKERFADYRINLKGLIASGQIVPATTYMRAQRIRTLFMEETREMLKGLDCVVTPSAPTPALLGLDSTGDPAFNAPWSFCGFPAITLPSGITKKGLPLGLQLVGVPYSEWGLLLHASWCESVLDFDERPGDPS